MRGKKGAGPGFAVASAVGEGHCDPQKTASAYAPREKCERQVLTSRIHSVPSTVPLPRVTSPRRSASAEHSRKLV